MKDKILAALEKNDGDYDLTAAEIHVSSIIVRETDIVENKRHNFTEEGIGPKHLQKYIVAVAKVHEGWDNTDETIREARDKYNRGEVEITTGRDGLNMMLYAIPRKTINEDTADYFIPEEEEEDDDATI